MSKPDNIGINITCIIDKFRDNVLHSQTHKMSIYSTMCMQMKFDFSSAYPLTSHTSPDLYTHTNYT